MREALLEDGVDLGVVNCRFVKPLDGRLLRDLSTRYPILITIEENTLRGGFGSGVHEFFVEGGSAPASLYHLGIPDRFVNHGSMPQVLEEVGLTPSRLVPRVREIVRGRA